MLKLASRLGRRDMSSNNTHSVAKRLATLSIAGGALGGCYCAGFSGKIKVQKVRDECGKRNV